MSEPVKWFAALTPGRKATILMLASPVIVLYFATIVVRGVLILIPLLAAAWMKDEVGEALFAFATWPFDP